MKVELAARARHDLNEIWKYIAVNNGLVSADKIIDKITETAELVGKFPELGKPRPELEDGLRAIASDQYLIFYKREVSRVRVTRIIHGARDLPAIFTQ